MTSLTIAWSRKADPEAAVAALADQLASASPLELVLFFVCPDLVTDRTAAALNQAFPEPLLIGCTTAGEITPDGYQTGSIAAVAFSKGPFRAVAGGLSDLSQFAFQDAETLSNDLADHLRARGGDLAGRSFGCLLIDGLCGKEEALATCFARALAGMPLFGASAGDMLDFADTRVFFGGAFHRNACVLVIVDCTAPFRVFRSQTFVSTEQKLVVTDADPSQRLVRELNAETAIVEYARVNGLEPEQMTPLACAKHPLVLRAGGADYVRAVRRVNPDGSLVFFAAIDEGLVLTTAVGWDPIGNLVSLFGELEQQVGQPDVVLAFDFVQRQQLIEEAQGLERARAVMAANRMIGFRSFGEQFSSMHVNQTLTGVAIGRTD